MKILGLGMISFMVVGCAHFEDAPKVVHFPYATELLEKVQMKTTRRPASLQVGDISGKSSRRIYFSALYHQYLTLGDYLGIKSEVLFCPQFHHDKLQTDSGLVPKVSLYHSSHVDEEGKNYFPEFAFNKEFPLKDYHQTITDELTGLCEDGVSDNFYKFDNLVTHYSHKNSFHKDPRAMGTVLKIPVFANFYLLKMLEVPGLNLQSPKEKDFIRLTNTFWFEDYIAEASRMRNNFIKNKMVKR